MMVLLIPAFGQTTAEEWFDKGVALMNQSKCDEAVKAFDKAIEINPQYLEAWAWKGWAFYVSSDYNGAVQAYDKATKLNPNYADAWVGKGFATLALGFRSTELVGAFHHAILLDRNYPLAWLGMAVIGLYYNLEAVDPNSLNNAIQLNPTYATEILSDTLQSD